MDDHPIAEWRAAYERVCDLVGHLEEDEAARRVPACPDWTVRDLLSHVVGLGADVLDGDEPDDHNPGWTRRQVDARRDRSVAELLDEWALVAAPLVAWMREHGSRPLNDVVIHEQDLRGALARPGGLEGEGLVIVRERMVTRFAGATVGSAPIALVASDDGWRWCSHGDVEDAAVLLEASGFDLFRALTSRRTADQLRGWTARGDVEEHLAAFAGLGELPSEPLPE